jgi:hypothetical protein
VGVELQLPFGGVGQNMLLTAKPLSTDFTDHSGVQGRNVTLLRIFLSFIITFWYNYFFVFNLSKNIGGENI